VCPARSGISDLALASMRKGQLSMTK